MKIKFEPRDLWVGLYWTPAKVEYFTERDRFYKLPLPSGLRYVTRFYLCIVPMFPIIFEVEKR